MGGWQSRRKLEGSAASQKLSWVYRSQGFVLIPHTLTSNSELPVDRGLNRADSSQRNVTGD